jgi:vacuolar-type H+-ATPase subunit F/Vma7
MSRVAVVGEARRVEGFALAGAVVLPAAEREQVLDAWRGLPEDVAIVLVTPPAADALAAVDVGSRLVVTLPA